MPKRPRRANKEWKRDEVRQLKDLADGNTPTRVIALKLQRTADAVYAKASDKNISLKPTDRRSNRRSGR